VNTNIESKWNDSLGKRISRAENSKCECLKESTFVKIYNGEKTSSSTKTAGKTG
jgi:hypothetical protein